MAAIKQKKMIDWASTLNSMKKGESIEMSGIRSINNARRAASYQKSAGKGEWSVSVTDDKRAKFKIIRTL